MSNMLQLEMMSMDGIEWRELSDENKQPYVDATLRTLDVLQLSLILEKENYPYLTVDNAPIIINAIWRGNSDIADTVLSYGSYANVYFLCPKVFSPSGMSKTSVYITPLLLTGYGRITCELVESLILHGADPNLKDTVLGNTILHVLAERKVWLKDIDRIVEILIDAGADKSFKTFLDKTPYDILVGNEGNHDSPYFKRLCKLLA